MGAFAGLAQPVGGAPLDDLDLVGDVVAQRLVQRQRPRHAVDQREAVDPEGVLQLGVLVELVEHDLGVGVALELDHHAHALAGGLVAQVGDPRDGLGVDQLGDLLEQPGLVDHVGDLGDHDALALTRAAGLLDLADGTDLDRPTTGGEGLVGAGLAEDQPAGREVRGGHVLHEVDGGQRIVVDQRHRGVDQLAEVVRRDVGGHADRDAGRAVGQQVREPRGQDQRFLLVAVVVGDEVDGLLVDVTQQLHRQARQARLGVAHGRGWVAVDRAEVAVPVDQLVADREVLAHADQRVVDRRVAVRVVLLHHVADRGGALAVRRGGAQARLVHRVQDAAVHRLEAVPHVRQRPPHDHAHRVVEVRGLHLVLDDHRGHPGGQRLAALVDRACRRRRA